MRSPRAFLQTRIARRVFGLFLLCAVVPTATLATASYWLVSRELREQARSQLAQASKVSGTLLLARLHGADDDLIDVVAELDKHGEPPSEVLAPRLSRRFGSLTVSAPHELPRAIWGKESGSLPALAKEEDWNHLGQGRALVVVAPGPPKPTVYLVRALKSDDAHGTLLWGEISAAYLWSDRAGEPLAPAGMDLWVYAGDAAIPLYRSAINVGATVREVLSQPRQQGQQGFMVDGDEDGFIAGSSTIFLGFDYGTQPWTVVLVQPMASFTAPQDFRSTVLLTLALGLWLVVLASNVLLRHRLDPVARLQEGTRRLAGGDFSVAVSLSTNDEFEELATSFNTMASRLREQFTLLGVLHEVDREGLVARTNEPIVHTALRRLPELVPCAGVVIAVRRPASRGLRLSVWRAGGDRGVGGEVRSITPAELDELGTGPEHWCLAAGAPGPALLDSLVPDRDSARLVLPLTERGRCFGVILLSAPPGADTGFAEADLRRARQIADQVALALANTLLVERMKEMSWGTLEAFARTIDASSAWTAGHSERVTRVALAIGRKLALPAEQLDRLHRGGLLHDIGKIGVPQAILDKPAKLDAAEVALIRSHPELGAQILEPIEVYEDVIPIVRHHHERFDGTGYPGGLAGRDIPFLARVLTVADVYDALVSDRPYRQAWTSDAAVSYIAERSGAEFDPVITAAFLELVASPAWIAAGAVSAPTACSARRMMAFTAGG
jgi:putative nucleotidyltransferase with HDIG domain